MRTARFAIAVAALPVLLGAMGGSTAAAASNVPFTDENAHGAITLCGRNDQPVTAGSLLDRPFVWKAVSSAPAPARYTRAYLAVYQPIQHEDPANWTGYALTDVAVFANAAHPAAQATNLDALLLEPDRQIPPYWDGYYELRMFYTGPNEPAFTSEYPAAVIQVHGNYWSLVSGGSTPCSAGTAVSVDSKIASPAALATPQTVVVGSVGSASGSAPAAGQQSGSPSHPAATAPGAPGSTTSTTAGQSAAAALGPTSHAHTGGGGGATAAVVAGVVGAAAVVGASLVGLRRRRRRITA